MNKKPIIIAGLAVATAFSVLFVAANNKGFAFGPMAEGEIPTTLELNKTKGNAMTDKNGNHLPASGSQTHTPQEFELDEYTTIKASYCSLNANMFIRLNNEKNPDTNGVSYFEKEEACKGMTSIYIDLNYGYVDVLTGYEPGVFTNRYTVRPTTASAGDPIQKTITVEGNYFRVENVNTSTNALIKSISVNYGCTAGAETNDIYTMERGNTQDIVRGNRDHWFYHWNGNNKVSETPKPTYSNGTFTSRITAVDMTTTDQGVWYRFIPSISSGELTAEYVIKLQIKLSVSGWKVSGNDGDKTQKDIPQDTWRSFTFTARTTSDTAAPFNLCVKPQSELTAEYVEVVVRNICVCRTLA